MQFAVIGLLFIVIGMTIGGIPWDRNLDMATDFNKFVENILVSREDENKETADESESEYLAFVAERLRDVLVLLDNRKVQQQLISGIRTAISTLIAILEGEQIFG